jgi:hypothetical protein
LIQVVRILFGYLFCLYCVAFRWGAVRAKYGRLDLVRERIADGIPLRRFTDRALDLRVADLASVALPAELAVLTRGLGRSLLRYRHHRGAVVLGAA